MKSIVAILIMGWGACALADVYKWTDERGEEHYSETAPATKSEKLITNEQIQRTEQADQTRPQIPAENSQNIGDEVQHRISECQRFKSLRDSYLLNSNTAQDRFNAYSFGRGNAGPLYINGDNTNTAGWSEIEAGIRENCRE